MLLLHGVSGISDFEYVEECARSIDVLMYMSFDLDGFQLDAAN